MRIGKEMGDIFWTARGVRQKCPLSPMLFNLVLVDLEEKIGKVRWRVVTLGKESFYTVTRGRYGADSGRGR